MTKPKLRPCPSCEVRQQANRKTCSACFATLPSKRFLKTAKMNDDWGQRVIKNKNASRVVASAQIAVQKLSALGYMPILFISQRHKGTGKLMADVVMKRAYDFIIKLHGVPQPQQDQPHQDQPLPLDQPQQDQAQQDQPQQDQPLIRDHPQQDQPQQDQPLPLDQPQQDQPLPLDQLIPQDQPTPTDQQIITLDLFTINSQAQQHVEPRKPRKKKGMESHGSRHIYGQKGTARRAVRACGPFLNAFSRQLQPAERRVPNTQRLAYTSQRSAHQTR
ncbi:hypothetical protein DPX16_2912 [Anabarilius grahami]|uniref:Uncharacterized protein n=1 Tax=Anabarilius grahami TaxID=495550 RepID=A0A3N0Y500_ANAGA|nr:hypothetical protein DPX16_2912 [Anabarilius grahami]